MGRRLSASEVSEREKLIVQFLSDKGETSLSVMYKELRRQYPTKFVSCPDAFFLFVQRRGNVFSLRYAKGCGRGGKVRLVSLLKSKKVNDDLNNESSKEIQSLVSRISARFAKTVRPELVGLSVPTSMLESIENARVIKSILEHLELVLKSELIDIIKRDDLVELRVEITALRAQIDEERASRVRAEQEREEVVAKVDLLKNEFLNQVPSTSATQRAQAIASSSLQLRNPSCSARI